MYWTVIQSSLFTSGLCCHQHWNLASGVENFSLDDSRQVRENICDDNLVLSFDIKGPPWADHIGGQAVCCGWKQIHWVRTVH